MKLSLGVSSPKGQFFAFNNLYLESSHFCAGVPFGS